MNLVVYTAIIGNTRDVPRPIVAPRSDGSRETRFVCFTDADRCLPSQRGGWEMRPPYWEHATSSRRTARWHKVNAHLLFDRDGDCGFSLWHDGTHQLTIDPWWLVAIYLTGGYEHNDADLATFRHPDRDCVYAELDACLRLRKDDPAVMRDQVERYRAAGYPRHAGLFETSAVLRRHCPATQAFNDAWWAEIAAGSCRDQLSVNWAARRTNVQYSIMEGRRDRSPYFNFYPHHR